MASRICNRAAARSVSEPRRERCALFCPMWESASAFVSCSGLHRGLSSRAAFCPLERLNTPACHRFERRIRCCYGQSLRKCSRGNLIGVGAVWRMKHTPILVSVRAWLAPLRTKSRLLSKQRPRLRPQGNPLAYSRVSLLVLPADRRRSLVPSRWSQAAISLVQSHPSRKRCSQPANYSCLIDRRAHCYRSWSRPRSVSLPVHEKPPQAGPGCPHSRTRPNCGF